jgi:hypothetical protein
MMVANRTDPKQASRGGDPFPLETAQEFHRRMASAIEQVQAGIWQAGMHDLIGYSTDFSFGQGRGVQTLVLKTHRKSAYLRLHWDTVLGTTEASRQAVKDALHMAITELS